MPSNKTNGNNRLGGYFVFLARIPFRPMRRLYNWTISWAKTDRARWALFGVSFADSSFFPIPPDVLLIPMVVANVKRWFVNALICLCGSLSGALLGYFIGWGLYESVGRPIVDFYNLQTQVEVIGQRFAANGFWTVFVAAFTPIPFKVITISAGLFKLPLALLMLASLLGRGGRFFIVAGALRIFGRKIAETIEKYFDWFSIIFAALLIGGFIVVKYLF